jgi:ABC-type dipeptide/oligopeptide/nickel transport system permease component
VARFLFRRLLEVVPVLLLVSFAVFMLVRMVPGDPARLIAGDNATPEQLEQTRQQLGLTGSQ